MRVARLRQVYRVVEDLEAQVAFFGERLGLELRMGVPPGISVPVFQVTDLDQALADVCRRRERPSVHEMGPRVLHQRGT